MRLPKLFIATLFAGLISLASPAFADTYNYQGGLLSEPNGYGSVDFCAGGTAPCSITGTFTITGSLGANAPWQSITPTSFSFSDGFTTALTNLNSNVINFDVATDANGNIDFWQVYLMNSDGGGEYIYTGEYGPAYVNWADDEAGYNGCCSVVGGIGTWTDPSTPTPEPSSFLLLSNGLIGLGFIKRKAFRS